MMVSCGTLEKGRSQKRLQLNENKQLADFRLKSDRALLIRQSSALLTASEILILYKKSFAMLHPNIRSSLYKSSKHSIASDEYFRL